MVDCLFCLFCFVFFFVCLFVCLFVCYFFICFFVRLFVSLFVFLFASLFLCLFVSFFLSYNTYSVYFLQVISILDSLLVDESQPVAVPIAGDLVPEANGHFLYTSTNTTSARRGFVVLQNSNEKLETGNQCK